jgi:hypothetical protein
MMDDDKSLAPYKTQPAPDQTPPPGYEPQTDLAPDQVPGVYARESDLIADAEDEDPDAQPEAEGDADDGDDEVQDADDN